jgi:Uma2 family endonuclease
MGRLLLDIEPLSAGGEPVVLSGIVSREQYLAFCQANPEMRAERSAIGEVTILPPAHSRSGFRNLRIASQLDVWAMRDQSGVGFDSSAGFDLPNGANRSPDASWVLKSRIDALSKTARDEFLPLCPDFVVELRSGSDRLRTVQAKMREYIENGARLGWLIDPESRRVWVYRSGRDVELLEAPPALSGEDVLPGFRLELEQIWSPPL